MRWVTLQPALARSNWLNPHGVTVDADSIVAFRCVSAGSEVQPAWLKIVAVTVAGAELVVDEYWFQHADESWDDFHARTLQRIAVLTNTLRVLT